MRLYSLMNASSIDDPVYGHFRPDPDHGGFDLPDELADRLHSVHYRKRRAWETDIERDERLHGEESARRRDPETLYNAVAGIAGLAQQLAGASPAAPADPAVLAEIAALRQELAELRASREGDAGEPAPPKPSRSRAKDTPAEA